MPLGTNDIARADPGFGPAPVHAGGAEGRLLAMAESLTGVGYWSLRLADMQTFWSEQVYRIHGVSPESFTPQLGDALDFFHPDDRPAINAQFSRAMTEGVAFAFEARLLRADGAERIVVSRGACEHGPDGAPAAIVGVVQDITEQRRAEAMQREQSERLSRFIERLPAGAVHARAGALTMNAALEQITGYSREELPTLKSWFRKLYGDDTGKLLARYEQNRRDGFKSIVQGVIRRKDGERRVLELRACDDPSGEIWIVHDVTDREAMQDELVAARDRAEVAARANSEFLANMSHELRTPLTAIIGFTGLLGGQAGLDELQRHWVTRIDDAGKALLAIVNDVLDFSKLEAGSVELESEAFEPRRLVADTLALLNEQAARKSISLAARIAEGLPDSLVGDTGRLRQVLLNLVSNAVKFTIQGGVLVAAEPEARVGQGQGVRFSVTDTGIGIPEAALGQIFQRFVQADGSISRRFGGSGLGLAICARLVELMGGEIGVESRLGEGSTFWFWVPLGEAGQAAQPTTDEAAVRLDALRVLLVEDAEPNQELVCTLLQAVGVEVAVAGNGAEAIEAVRTDRYDLILMDVQMPVMGGVQATEIIRSLGGDHARIPIIALSANVMAEQVAAYQRAGMNAHLAKPINPRDLLITIARWSTTGEPDEAQPLDVANG
ncbi:hybrid sensor histidine kinase/response regulator [Phenylobacterium montanum]|uniref:histidine kinase n=1 Tax=Phenylobacterium montanum TaxID=2823693 RepID=A0A975FYR7_9CAUL|nr:hybrid sensor histidine kinase/response regulator [Caulobacter sp. S6]QUD87397.1 PAS domain-containing protein [Caulobacter sp. S6]